MVSGSRQGPFVSLDAGVPITVLAGVHPGCFELFVQEPIRTFTDLKGKQVGITRRSDSAPHLYVSIMAAHVGLDPENDINWVTTDDVASPMELFVQGKIDAYLAFVPEPPELRARKIGHVIVNMAHGPAMVAVLLLHVGRQRGLRPATIRSRPSARCAPS